MTKFTGKVGKSVGGTFPGIDVGPDAELTKPLNVKPTEGAPVYPEIKHIIPESVPLTATPKEAPKDLSGWQRMVQKFKSWRGYWQSKLQQWKQGREAKRTGNVNVKKEPYPFARDEAGNPRAWKSAQDAEIRQRAIAEMNAAMARKREVDQWRADMQRYNEAVKKWRGKSNGPRTPPPVPPKPLAYSTRYDFHLTAVDRKLMKEAELWEQSKAKLGDLDSLSPDERAHFRNLQDQITKHLSPLSPSSATPATAVDESGKKRVRIDPEAVAKDEQNKQKAFGVCAETQVFPHVVITLLRQMEAAAVPAKVQAPAHAALRHLQN